MFTEKYPPLTPLDVRHTVRASSHMKLRVKAWYAKELELDGEIERSTMPVHAPDDHGGFYMLSANSRHSRHPIENVLNRHQDYHHHLSPITSSQ
jgi:hypothetical protein